MPVYNYINLNGFNGGLNIKDSPTEIADDQLREAMNVVLTRRGAAKKRSGFRKDLGGVDSEGNQRLCWPAKSVTPSNIIKIDPTDTNLLDYHTKPGTYRKMVHDNDGNRSFVLQQNFTSTTSNAIVTVIDHSKDQDDADFITELNRSTLLDFPEEYNQNNYYCVDMAYNGDDKVLALGMLGCSYGTPTEYYPATVVLINMDTTSDDYLKCSTLRNNPFQNGYGSILKFVRYFDGRYYTFSRVDAYGAVPGPGDYTKIYQLGYFDAETGEFTLCFQYGYALEDKTQPNGEEWDSSVLYPNQPRWYPIYPGTPVAPSTAGYWGDPSLGISDNVATFEIIPDNGGEIIIGTNPTMLTAQFAMEPFVYRISIPLMDAELDEDARLIGVSEQTESSVLNPMTGRYYLKKGYVNGNITRSVDGLAITNMNGGGLSYVKMSCNYAAAGHLYVTSDFGTSVAATDSATSKSAAVSFFSYGDRVINNFVHGDVLAEDVPFKATFTFSLYKLIPGLIEVIGIHSSTPLCDPVDTDRPVREVGNITSPITKSFWLASAAYPSATNLVLWRGTYFPNYDSFALSFLTSGGAVAGFWVYRHTCVPETRTFTNYTTYNGISASSTMCRAMSRIDASHLCLCSNTNANDKNAINYWDWDELAVSSTAEIESVYTDPVSGVGIDPAIPLDVFIDTTNNIIGFMTFLGNQIWFYDYQNVVGMTCDLNTKLWYDNEPILGTDNGTRLYTNYNTRTIIAGITATKIGIYGETDEGRYAAASLVYNYERGVPVQFVNYRDYCFSFNGTSKFYWYDGSLIDKYVLTSGVCHFSSSGVTGLQPRLICVCDDRFFMVSAAHDRNTIFFSQENVWTTNPSTDILFPIDYDIVIPERNSDKEGVTNMISFGNRDEMLVFRARDTWVLTGSDWTDYDLMKLSGAAGCVSPRGAVETPDGSIIFVGVEQIWEYDGNSINPIGNEILPKIKGVDLSTAVVVYDAENQVVRIGYSGGTLVWNVSRRIWDGATVRAWTEFDICFDWACQYTDPSDYNKLVFGRRDVPYVYEANCGTTDDGSDIRFTIQTKTFDLNEFAEKKRFRLIKALAGVEEFDAFDVSLIINNGENQDTKSMYVPLGTIWGEFVWGQSTWSGDSIRVGDVSASDDLIMGNNVSIRCDKTSSKDLTIYKLALYAAMDSGRKENT